MAIQFATKISIQHLNDKNDTNDIIFYNQDIEHKQKKKKYPKFFDLLKK